MQDLLKRLIEVPGVSGFEEPIREEIQKIVGDKLSLQTDVLGNLFGILGTGAPHIMLIAHMDELGLAVTHIEDNGCLRFRKIGGIDDRILPSRSVLVHTKSGPVRGVIGLIPPHLRIDRTKKLDVIPWHEMVIDLCTRSKEETRALGVRLLDPITFVKDPYTIRGEYLCGRAIDDRFGCAILIKVLERLSEITLDRQVSFVWSVQEEIGLRGAKVAGNRLKPDIVLAVDSYATGDAPDVPFYLAPTKVGGGPVMRFMDNMAIASKTLRNQLEDLAQELKLPLQIGATGGATDGGAIQVADTGALMMAMSVPVRYLHSTVEICHLEDLSNLVNLIAYAARKLKKDPNQ